MQKFIATMNELSQQEFLALHPICVFCGGAEAASTREHCPPKSLFQHKQWPHGFDFPACAECNGETSDDDVVVAFLSRMHPVVNTGNKDGRVEGLMRSVNNQHPGFLKEMFGMSAVEARKAARKLGVKPPKGMTYQKMGLARVPDRMDKAVQTIARKLTKALFYRETNTIFPLDGEITFKWFTNADKFREGSIPVLEFAANFTAPASNVTRSGKDLRNQFDYKYSLSVERDLAVLTALFGPAFGFVTVACSKVGVLADIEARAVAAHGGVKQFVFI